MYCDLNRFQTGRLMDKIWDTTERFLYKLRDITPEPDSRAGRDCYGPEDFAWSFNRGEGVHGITQICPDFLKSLMKASFKVQRDLDPLQNPNGE
jgi:hypothetical protein